ncbi:hypothetical protein JVU11DRAFT_5100 [Chiua virens]|nr:hypothetical protein JVU11DRAFT_5100 [Chiua virens]
MARLQPGSSKPPSKPHPHQPSHPQSQPHNPQVARHRSRHRSYSDPFSDPVHQSKPIPRLPPEPPPKYPPHSKMVSTDKQPHRDNIADAVKDTVQVRSSDPSRTRTGRSQTVVASQAPRAHGRRSMSQDSVLHAANALEKAKTKPRGKKGSAHADIIDRLDFSGVGPMFHHDGPFDACAPSRNRHRSKAPMLAWSRPPNEDVLPPTSSPYPSPDVYNGGFSPTYDNPKKKVDAIAEAWGIHEPEPYEEFFAGGGTARRDGDTPSSSIYAGKEGHNSRHGTPQHSIGRRSKDGRDLREVYREYLDDDPRQSQAREKDRADREGRRPRRGALPPPQPIMVPEAHEAHQSDVDSGPGSPSGAPKRTKSLMQRIRKMRDSPNVPVGYDDVGKPPSPTVPDQYQSGARPTHRSQNSFLGRFAGNTDRRGNMKENMSPMSDNSETYVYIDDPRKEKQLPAPPHAPATSRTPSGEDRYADYDGMPGSPGSGAGLGRKTSLLKKVKDAVRGPK